MVNSMMGTRTNKNGLPTSLKCNNRNVTGKDAICSTFNHFFFFISDLYTCKLASSCTKSGNHISNIKIFIYSFIHFLQRSTFNNLKSNIYLKNLINLYVAILNHACHIVCFFILFLAQLSESNLFYRLE